jgi:hypothetical protein
LTPLYWSRAQACSDGRCDPDDHGLVQIRIDRETGGRAAGCDRVRGAEEAANAGAAYGAQTSADAKASRMLSWTGFKDFVGGNARCIVSRVSDIDGMHSRWVG